MSYPPKLAELLETLALLPDRMDRIDFLISIADRFVEVPERIATRPFPEDRQVPACESEAYLWAEKLPEGTLKLHFAIENPQGISAMAMAVILDESLSGEPPELYQSLSGDVVYEIFGRELSMGKTMGLMGMVSMVTASARKLLEERRPAEHRPAERGSEVSA